MSILSLVLLSSMVGHPPSSVPRPQAVTLQGRVRAASAGHRGAARVLLVTKNAEEFELHTPNRAEHKELERLAGVTVRIRGYKGDSRLPRGRHIMVNRYEILDVGAGKVPELGIIAALDIDGKSRLLFVSEAGQATLLPNGWARKMKRHVGAKIWMVGKRKNGQLKPTRFAILRSAAHPPKKDLRR